MVAYGVSVVILQCFFNRFIQFGQVADCDFLFWLPLCIQCEQEADYAASDYGNAITGKSLMSIALPK